MVREDEGITPGKGKTGALGRISGILEYMEREKEVIGKH